MLHETQSAIVSRDTERHLREIVEKHTLRYEVCFEQDKIGDEIAETRFDIDLLASHDHAVTRLTPGCSLCESTFDDLREIATWSMAKEIRAPEYMVEQLDNALHMDASHKLRPEVRLALKIQHRRNKQAPLDDCEWR